MKQIRTIYIIVSFFLIAFFGYHYFQYQFNKKVVFVDKSKEDLIGFFHDIALGAEYGGVSRITRKWKDPMKIYIVKDSTYDFQKKVLQKTIDTLNTFFSDGFSISITKDSLKSNALLFLCSQKKLKAYPEPYKRKFKNVDQGTFGFFNFSFVNNYINNTSIFIDTTKPLSYQKGAIMEEVTQSLGFANDTDIYSNSMFYQNKIVSQKMIYQYSDFDKKIIQMLYHPKMRVGLDRLKVEPILRDLLSKEDD